MEAYRHCIFLPPGNSPAACSVTDVVPISGETPGPALPVSSPSNGQSFPDNFEREAPRQVLDDLRCGQASLPRALVRLNHPDPAQQAIHNADYARYVPSVFQKPSDSLPPAILLKISQMMVCTALTGHEYAFMAMEFSDGTVVASELISSGQSYRVDNSVAMKCAIDLLISETNRAAERGVWPVRVYNYHTHPERSLVGPDQRGYTETNTIDCKSWDSFADRFVQRLSAGLSAQASMLQPLSMLPFENGAVPSFVAHDKGLPYVATYIRGKKI